VISDKSSELQGILNILTMPEKQYLRLLVINSGSSSIKFAVYQMGQTEKLAFRGHLERIGLKAGSFEIQDSHGASLFEQHINLPNHDVALKQLFNWLENDADGQKLDAVGHRVVHGGLKYDQPQIVNNELVADLKKIVPLAPDHLPHEIKAIRAISVAFPSLLQVACFDTAFHRSMPRLAQLYALPRHYWHEGITRYGFHGLSYEYIAQELRKEAGDDIAMGRLIIAHLGNGASMTAIRRARSIDTTMGLTPSGGLVMSTRSGDLDPGVLLYLLEEKGIQPSHLNTLISEQAGLLGVSGISSDMKDLLEKSQHEPHAAEAVNLFCYQAKKFLGALAAVLGGLDTLVFTGGIGENAPLIRQGICEDMEFLGIQLDTQLNHSNAAIISQENSRVSVRVMKTNEELMIARHTRNLIQKKENDDENRRSH
jgi:acetate kinase